MLAAVYNSAFLSSLVSLVLVLIGLAVSLVVMGQANILIIIGVAAIGHVILLVALFANADWSSFRRRD